jgi:hypothetical protein
MHSKVVVRDGSLVLAVTNREGTHFIDFLKKSPEDLIKAIEPLREVDVRSTPQRVGLLPGALMGFAKQVHQLLFAKRHARPLS